MTDKPLSKEELRRPDAFIAFFRKSATYLQNHIREIIIFSIVILVGIVGLFMVMENNRQMNKEASDEYAKVVQSLLNIDPSNFNFDDWKAFNQKAAEFTRKYPKSSMLPMLRLYQAKTHIYVKKYEDALKEYHQASLQLETPYRYLALEGKAIVFEFTEEFNYSEEVWQELVSEKDNPFLDYHLYSLGLVQKQMGQTQKALDTFAQIEKEHASSAYLSKAKQQRLLLEN